MKNIITCLFLVPLLFFSYQSTVSAESLQPFVRLQGKLEIAGETTALSIMKHLAKNIMMSNPNIWISVSGGGTTLGIEKTADGSVDIGNSGRPLTDNEKQIYGLVDLPFAIDCLAIVVNTHNKIKGLTVDQVKKIYSGEVKNWKELGGNNAPITIYARDVKSGTQATFSKLILDKKNFSSLWNILKSNGSMRTAVSLDENAIGFLSIGFLDQRKRIKKIALNGVFPTLETTKDGSYILTRKLYMNIKNMTTSLTKAFIDYIYSPEGASIISQAGYIPIEKQKEKFAITQ